MNLKFIEICDRNGRKTEPILHYWDDDIKEWVEIDLVTIKTYEYENKIKDKNI